MLGAGSPAWWENGTVSTSESSDLQRPGESMELVSKPRQLIRWSIVTAAIIVVTFAVVGVLLERSEAGTVFTLADQIGIVGIGVILAGGALMFTRPRVWADDERVRVRNVFTTKTLPWGVVREVGVSRGASWGVLDLQDDDQVSMLGLQIADGQRSVDAMRRLRELHESAIGDRRQAR